MTESISFADDIAALRIELKREEVELAELEEQRRGFTLQTREARQALDRLRKTLQGETTESSPRRVRRTAQALEVNAESGRPSRGARREQIAVLCRQLGRNDEEFETKDILAELTRIEGELSQGIRSYVYAVMNSLEEEGLIVKVDRGTWNLA